MSVVHGSDPRVEYSVHGVPGISKGSHLSIPEGWTDDMNVPLPPGCTVDEVVEHVIQNMLAGVDYAETERQLADLFELSAEDAALARDRTEGGIVRAATRNMQNCPDRAKDPMAWTSFQRAMADPSIVVRICPTRN